MANGHDPRSKTNEEARTEATEILAGQGWVFVPELAEFRHSDGRRARMTFDPDMGSIVNGSATHVRAVGLQLPGRKPTMDDLRNRRPTAVAPVDVIRYW